MSKKLLIVEESLKDLKGHWYELLKIICDSAYKKGWKTEVACNYNATSIIRETFSSFPVFKNAIYIDIKKSKTPFQKYYGVLLHNFRSLRTVWPILKVKTKYDLVFVSTVLIHHLLMWYVIMLIHPQRPNRLTLFFITNPGKWDASINDSYLPKGSFMLRACIRLFSRLVSNKKVVLAVGTKKSKEEFQRLCELPFELMPQPVTIDFNNIYKHNLPENKNSQIFTFSCLGFARHEKGSDILKLAIEKILVDHQDWPVKFIFQWTDDFILPDGNICTPGHMLISNSKVILIQKTLMSTEYQNILNQTDCMILPYRNTSYYARVSQIATEAICLEIPIIYTKGGWIEETVIEFGTGIGILEDSVEEIVTAIASVLTNKSNFINKDKLKIEKAREYFSANYFTKLLLQG